MSLCGELKFAALALLAACDSAPTSIRAVPVGQPFAELSEQERGRFDAGAALFNRIFKPKEGLGPLFNENACSACHTNPAPGGTGDQFVIKASRFTPPGRCDQLNAEGGENVRKFATPALRAHGITTQPFPMNAAERTRFNVPFLFGLGLVEAIPEEGIRERADPDDANGDGISGRAGQDARGEFARFGRKAEFASIRDFVDSALRFEMGLTTPQHPHEPLPPSLRVPPQVDVATDPEMSNAAIDRLTDFVRFLAPPTRVKLEDAVAQQNAERGEQLFHAIGCVSCHTPWMRTGRNESRALDRQQLFLYSDLLLHDIGPQLASVCGMAATPTELRTEPLMGLRHRSRFLHDHRANDLYEAIFLHGGEAAAASARFRQLNEVQQARLVAFLRTL